MSWMPPARPASNRQILVIGHQAEMVARSLLGTLELEFALQAEQLGTGHAIMMAEPMLRSFPGDLVVLCGDMPLVRAETIERLVAETASTGRRGGGTDGNAR